MKIVKISALWCPGCLIINNSINKIKEEFGIEVIEYDYDFDDIGKYNVGNILPVLIFIKDEKEVSRLVGERSYKDIKEVIEKWR